MATSAHYSTFVNVTPSEFKFIFFIYIYRERETEREREWILVDNCKASKYAFSVLIILWLPNSL